MRNSRLGNRGKHVVVGERDEVVDQVLDELGGWWDKVGRIQPQIRNEELQGWGLEPEGPANLRTPTRT